MSTKTMKQRIALVAVSALTAGVLSVVSTPVANATSFSTADTLILGTSSPLSGTALGTTVLTTATPGLSSFGLVSILTGGTAVAADATDNAYRTLASGNSSTGVILPTAKLGFALDATAAGSIVVSGGTITSPTGHTGLSPSLTAVVGTTAFFGAVITPNPGATTMVVQSFTGSGVGITTPTSGALVGIYTFTVAAASASGVVSVGDSTVTQQAGISAGTAASTVLTYDTGSRMTNGAVGLIYLSLVDAYGTAVTTGTLTATATNGATVNAVVAGSAAAGDSYAATTSFDSVGNSSGAFYVYVNQPVANTAGSAVVTLTLSGTALPSKTLNWQGQAATIALNAATSASIFENGYAAYASGNAKNVGIDYTIKDAAGNNVTVTTFPTLSDATGSMIGASLSAGGDASGTRAAGDLEKLAQTSSNGYGLATMLIPSSSLSGAGTYTLSFVNASGVTIKSSVINAVVSRGSLTSFTAGWDKATYIPGEIATLTITAKDAYGNLMADGTAATGLDRTVNSSGFTQIGTALTTSSTFAGGVLTEKYAVGNTEGSYSFSVDITTSAPQSATVGSLPIKAATSAVSNADVLKSIVALIASINKQIQALQKLILKR